MRTLATALLMAGCTLAGSFLVACLVVACRSRFGVEAFFGVCCVLCLCGSVVSAYLTGESRS